MLFAHPRKRPKPPCSHLFFSHEARLKPLQRHPALATGPSPLARLFLLGLEKYDKGDWRSISENFVMRRTPTQFASNAQKFFICLNSGNKGRRRSNIHDITTVGHGDAPVTPQMNAKMSPPGNSGNQSSDQSTEPPSVGVYGTAIGHPVISGVVTTIGTPVTLPVPGAPQMVYGVQAQVTTV